MSDQLKEVSHDYLRYANCWEDADVLMKGLDVKSGDRILSIASAGDNSFSMLVYDPELVVAVDINSVQLNLIELKKAAMKVLDHEAFLRFMGFSNCTTRWHLFLKVKEAMTPEMADFWTDRKSEIENGIIYQGKFEKYFILFHKKILPLIHTKKRIKNLFKEKDAAQQQLFFKKKWNSLRWKILFKMFFSKFVMGRLGRDPKFLEEVEVPVSTFILGQSQKHLSSINCQHNYFLQFILTGKFNTRLPHYARKENFEKIKSRLDRLIPYHGLAEDAFNAFSQFNKFNLSNIFEYMDPNLFKMVSDNLIENGEPGSKYAYWNLMVPRQMSKISTAVKNDATANDLSTIDCGFFYGNFIIDVKS
jgi:S-adenosylmethionine-diacylglycerol 3-amino-3-carboxypropyl transferase